MILYSGIFIGLSFVAGVIVGLMIARDHYIGGGDE